MGLSDDIMKEVKRYDDGNGCTRRQLVDGILMLLQQSCAATTPTAATEAREQGPFPETIGAAILYAKKLNAETETVFTDGQGTWFGARLDNHPTTAAFEMCATCLQVNRHEDECPEGYHPLSASVPPSTSEVIRAAAEELRSACCDAPTRTANTDYNVCTACKEPCDTNTAVPGSPSPAQPAAKCVWKYDSDGYWQTSCGDHFRFFEGGPTENRMSYCHCCGRRIITDTEAGVIDSATRAQPEGDNE